MDGLEDIIDVAGPDFQETKSANEKTAKQKQQTKLAFKQQEKPSAINKDEKVAVHTSVTGDEESEGLEFIDPEAEKRAKRDEKAKEREGEVQMIVSGLSRASDSSSGLADDSLNTVAGCA